MRTHRAAAASGATSLFYATRILSIAMVSTLLAGCLSQVDTHQETVAYAIDQDAIVVSLPVDEAVMTIEEQGTLAFAVALSLESCLEVKGVGDGNVYDRRQETNEVIFYEIGPWTPEMASMWGYDAPPDTKEKERIITASYTPAEQKAIDHCYDEDSTIERFEQAEFELDELKHRVLDSAPEWDESLIETIRQDLNDCLSESGYSLPSANADQHLWTPIQVNGATAEEERQIALVDVDCKDQHDVVDRWAKVSADWENEAIAVHTAEIASYRKKYDPVIAEARQIIESAA